MAESALSADNGEHVLERVVEGVVQLTGLPKDYMQAEISSLLGTPADSVNTMTLDQLRIIMLNYLEVINAEMTADFAAHSPDGRQVVDISAETIYPQATDFVGRH